MSRFRINPSPTEGATRFLSAIADKASDMSSEQAERFFDRQWERIRSIRERGLSDRTAEEISDVLIGLAIMRSMARVWKETGQ